MSGDSADADTTADERGVAPTTVEEIIADLRDAEIAPPEEPARDLTTAEVADLVVRARLPNSDIEVEDAEELGLTPWASAWVTPQYDQRGGDVSLSITAEAAEADLRTSSCAELEPDEARTLALQLLASAAVADDSTDGPEGYLAE